MTEPELAIRCPQCGAGPMIRCTRPDRIHVVPFHPERVAAVKEME